MGRGSVIERALSDAVELRALARASPDASLRSRLGQIARRRCEDIGPSVPKLRAAQVLGVSLTALDKWIERGAIPVRRRSSSSRQEVDTDAVIDLAVEIRALRATGRTRALLATALARLNPADERNPAAAMGTRGFFPDQAEERRREFALLTPGERVAQAITLSRSATRIAAAAALARAAKGTT
jgi:phage terminase Nu1 subunit (DNA packaging protein)